jgi:hypothetical protein
MGLAWRLQPLRFSLRSNEAAMVMTLGKETQLGFGAIPSF